MSRSARVDYDKIADLYDSQPYRSKSADPEFLSFVRERPASGPIRVLDIACGTGNQLIANRALAPQAQAVGIDASLGMLRRARPKALELAWVQADAAALPVASGGFDLIGCQFAFHHFRDKPGMLGEVFRVLRPGGRFVLHNMCPEECPDWLYYEYFPAAQEADRRDFWPVVEVTKTLEALGFAPVVAAYEHVHFEQNLSDWRATLRRRDICSQLQAISDADYAAGLRRLEDELAAPTKPRTRPDHLCFVTIRADKPAAG